MDPRSWTGGLVINRQPILLWEGRLRMGGKRRSFIAEFKARAALEPSRVSGP